MLTSTLEILVFISATACTTSFAWSMRRFFSKPSGSNAGIKAIYIFGSACSAMQLFVIGFYGCSSLSSAAVGLTCFCISLFLFWATVLINQKKPLSFAFSGDVPEHLVVQGPYRVIRHPFYTSYTISWVAGAVATTKLILVIPIVVMGLLYFMAAKHEENKFQASELSKEYSVYMSRTGMFIPKVAALFRWPSQGSAANPRRK